MHNHYIKCDFDLEHLWLPKDAYFRLVTTLFGILVTDKCKSYWCHRHHKHQDEYTIDKKFYYILPHYIFNNNFRNLLEEDENMAITFILVPLTGDHGYFESNILPNPASFTKYIDI